MQFKVVFKGQLVEGYSQEVVKANFAVRFKVGEARLSGMFLGKPVVLKKGVDERTARRIAAAVTQAGGICQVQPMEPAVAVQPLPPKCDEWGPDDPFASPDAAGSSPPAPALPPIPASLELNRPPDPIEDQGAPRPATPIPDPREALRQRQQEEAAQAARAAAKHRSGCLLIGAATAAVVLAFAFHFWWQNRTISQPPGIQIPQAPVQAEAPDNSPFRFKGYTITPRASFQIEARVLARKRYKQGVGADLVPLDLALGWGPMSDGTVLKDIQFSQSNRFYFWRVKYFPIPRREIEIHSANMHLIPADDTIWQQMKTIRKGHLIAIKGLLVDLRSPQGWSPKTSLRRTDTGPGACEIIWVESIQIL